MSSRKPAFPQGFLHFFLIEAVLRKVDACPDLNGLLKKPVVFQSPLP
jgi:hypothetical protein